MTGGNTRGRSILSVAPACLLVAVTLILGGTLSVAQAQHTGDQPLPAPDFVPDGPMGDAVRLGGKIVWQTTVFAKDYTGSNLNCVSCHLVGGRMPYASPWVGIWGVFPSYSARAGRVQTLEDRINDCFERSMNGTSLPGGGKEMRGILAYMRWLSQGVPTGKDGPGRGFVRIEVPQAADPERGKAIYAVRCASCHGADGQGLSGPKGEPVFPPLWGARSFNLGAGMARVERAAAFVKTSMPLAEGGSLTDQEALDVAAYFTQQPRPDFAGKHRDWPSGEKPRDARY